MAEFNLNQYPEPGRPVPPVQAQRPEPEEGSQLLHDIPRENRGGQFIKNVLLLLLLAAVIFGSFWVSFNLGKKLLMPVKKDSFRKIEAAVPEPPGSIAHLQKLALATREGEPEPATTTTRRPDVPARTAGAPRRTVSAYRGPYYKVQAGYFREQSNALGLGRRLRAAGFETYIRKLGDGWRVQVGAYRYKQQALNLRRLLKAKGFESVIIHE